MTTVNANDLSGGDTDPDGQTITYTCYCNVDNNSSVSNTNLCTSLPESFNTGTEYLVGLQVTPAAETYEIKITGTANSLSDDEFFIVTVNNVDRSPDLMPISDVTVSTENSAMSEVDVNDSNTSNDTDIDGETITYTCVYDTNVDLTVGTGTNCSSHRVPPLLTSTGFIGLQTFQLQCRLKITGTAASSASGFDIFVITVTDVDRAPVLTAVTDFGVNEQTAISQID